jgi:hypothetical protein
MIVIVIEVPINPIIQSWTRYYSSRKPLICDNIKLAQNGWDKLFLKLIAQLNMHSIY